MRHKFRENAAKTWLISLCAVCTLLLHYEAQAQETIDVGKITCNQFMFGQISDSRTISIWLSGYFNGTHNNTVVDVPAVQKNARDLVEYCMSHSSVILMDAARSVLRANK